MNYLGIDYGEAKIGLAKASDSSRVAVPFRTVMNGADLIDQLERIILAEGIEHIVVGYPLGLSGGLGAATRMVDGFIEKLKTLSLPITKQDERFSTTSGSFPRERDHPAAAALILATYLEAHPL
ncbi:MAG: pre-16S rRNA-processing nuclease YqgF [Parcubacteria group bacterium]|nr:pre-16S rRNA-processing nuclease YqgF [Parcubacteria group bacterium]